MNIITVSIINGHRKNTHIVTIVITVNEQIYWYRSCDENLERYKTKANQGEKIINIIVVYKIQKSLRKRVIL
jgi:hypothetical protein